MLTMRQATLASLVTVAALALAAGCSDSSGKGGKGFSSGDSIAITATPNPVTFPSVNIGGHAERTVQISHTGDSGTLKLRNIRLQANSAEISITQPAVVDLEAGESTSLVVSYDPTDGEYDSGSIFIDTNVATLGGSLTYEIEIETLAQVGSLVAIPSPVDFGEVPSGDAKPREILFTNAGADEIRVEGLAVQPGGGEDFTVSQTPELPFTIAPGGTFNAEVTYTPVGGGADAGFLVVSMNVDGAGRELEVLLRGTEISARLVAFPDPVDFGWRPMNQPHELPLNVTNQGNLPLVIDALELTEWSDVSVEVVGVPALPATLDPGAPPLALTVRFTPTPDTPLTTGPLAGVYFESNDPAEDGKKVVTVYGRAEAPSLQVNPPDSLEFGFVAQNLSTKRKVTLYNAGSAALDVTAVTVEETDSNSQVEYELQVDDSWGPTATTPAAGVLLPGEHRDVSVLFTNRGAATGTEFGTLRVVSNDPQRPDWPVDLVANRAGSPDCEVKLVPEQLDFGTVPRGFTKTLSMQLVISGSGDCSFHSALVNDCSGWGGFLGTACPDPATTLKQNGDSDVYTVSGYSWGPPLATPKNLKNGQVYQVDVTFKPPDSAPIFGDELTDYAGFFAVRVDDPYAPPPPAGQQKVLETYPVAQGAGSLTPFPANLHAKSGIADLSVFPQELDFGWTTIGCFSQTLTVNAYNVGTAPLDLTGYELSGCSVEFKVKSAPALPKVLNPGEGVQWDIVYKPQDEGGDACSLEITSNDADTPSAVVPLEGKGTYEDHWVDEFIQVSGQDVDVLFVVDNSGSMSEEQSNLASNFNSFISQAATWNNDYRIAVTTTDLENENGRFVGNPRIITKATTAAFKDNVKVGTNGSGTERGLAAAQSALSLPNVADSSIACTADADCTSPEACYDGFCGGPNRGFLRQDASLEVVIVSDEEDQSPADLSFYINFFKNIKGFFNDNLLHVHAIVGPKGGCSSNNGDAAAGLRYIDVANATGGNVASICEGNFAAALKSIGEIAFGLKVQFFLERPANPPTIQVTVKGQPCQAQAGGNTNWVFDPPSNSVIFNEFGGCMPQPGDKIVVEYDTICFLE